jgi:hypothetical protein
MWGTSFADLVKRAQEQLEAAALEAHKLKANPTGTGHGDDGGIVSNNIHSSTQC